MGPKKDIFYAKRGNSKSISLPSHMIVDCDNVQGPTYLPPGSTTFTVDVRVTTGTPGR